MTGYGIGFQKGSKWIEDFNKQLVRFQNDGEFECLRFVD
jgi:ABC-type amino acid transport substrate-binding protein